MASMARSVNCLGQKNAVQAHLIGAKPIVQVKSETKDKTIPAEVSMNQTRTKTHGNEPPGQAPRCTGRKNQPQQTRDFKDKSWYALTHKEVPWTML